ncbi:hypothetical protein D3C76_1525860 [compost metagenome]
MGELGRARHRFQAHVQDALQALAAPLFQAPVDQLETAANTGQQVVEVVRHTACQLADRFHLAGLVLGQRFTLLRFAASVQALLQIH